jgi:hypothetical protein
MLTWARHSDSESDVQIKRPSTLPVQGDVEAGRRAISSAINLALITELRKIYFSFVISCQANIKNIIPRHDVIPFEVASINSTNVVIPIPPLSALDIS